MGMKIKIDTSDMKRFELELNRFSLTALPRAVKNALNEVAFTAQTFARRKAENAFTLRNKWTIGSIRVNTTKGGDIARQQSATGSTEDYMRRQEMGGQVTKKGRVGVPITTSYAAGQQGARPRTRLARPSNRLKNIRLRKQRRTAGLPRKQRIFLTIKDAIENKNRHIFLDLGRKKGIFRVVGGTKRNTSAARIKMVADLSKTSTRNPRAPWLRPAADDARKVMGKIYRRALQREIVRARIFKDR